MMEPFEILAGDRIRPEMIAAALRLDRMSYDEIFFLQPETCIAYFDMLEKYITRFGFTYAGLNPAGGKIYETTVSALKQNPLVRKRYPKFCR